MAQAWHERPLDEFQCSQCGALYYVCITRLSAPICEEVVCQVCQMVMNEWRGTVGRAYTLKSQHAHE
jgi:hypothetical protein